MFKTLKLEIKNEQAIADSCARGVGL